VINDQPECYQDWRERHGHGKGLKTFSTDDSPVHPSAREERGCAKGPYVLLRNGAALVAAASALPCGAEQSAEQEAWLNENTIDLNLGLAAIDADATGAGARLHTK
jgi:hypothetical protein